MLNLPINGRQMSQLMLQAPGSVNSGTGTWQDVRFSGRAIEQNAIRYDGVEGSSIIDAAPGNLNGEIPTPFKLQASLENVQEFRVESSNYPAEYGTGTGGQVNVVTKSGTNAVHGSLFEYVRNDAFDSPNYFDTLAHLPKSTLKQNQFGGSVGGPFMKDKAFFFGSYEGYRLDAGVNFVEGVPSDAAWARAVPAIAPLRPGFKSPDAVLLPGASKDPDFDIAQLQGLQHVDEDAFSLRLDYRFNNRWSMYGRGFHDQGTNNQPEGVSGRVVRITDNPSNAVFNLQGVLSDRMTNELKVGYNASPTRINGIAPVINGIDFGNIVLNLSGRWPIQVSPQPHVPAPLAGLAPVDGHHGRVLVEHPGQPAAEVALQRVHGPLVAVGHLRSAALGGHAPTAIHGRAAHDPAGSAAGRGTFAAREVGVEPAQPGRGGRPRVAAGPVAARPDIASAAGRVVEERRERAGVVGRVAAVDEEPGAPVVDERAEPADRRRPPPACRTRRPRAPPARTTRSGSGTMHTSAAR